MNQITVLYCRRTQTSGQITAGTLPLIEF